MKELSYIIVVLGICFSADSFLVEALTSCDWACAAFKSSVRLVPLLAGWLVAWLSSAAHGHAVEDSKDEQAS